MASKLGETYAHALFSLAKDTERVEACLKDLKRAKEGLDDPLIHQALAHPDIGLEDKRTLVDRVFADELGQEVINLLKVLLDRGRIQAIDQILEAYRDLVFEDQDILRIKITSALDLSQTQVQDLVTAFAPGRDKDQVHVEEAVDPDLIGGLVIQVGNRILDRSIKGQLRDLQTQMKQG